jgi:predicted alpha/beta hydrolase
MLWHLLAPVLTRLYGYLPFSALGMGEDLPLGVYRQWKRWCGRPHYFFDDPATQPELHGFARWRIPFAAANATDDLWAPPASRDAFVQGYPHVRLERIELSPARLGLRAIGHVAYFHERNKVLWDGVISWFDRMQLERAPDHAFG